MLTALLLMLAVLMTSIAAARTAISGARMAGHERDRMLALQGAMAALADAEQDIEGGADPASARAAALTAADAAAFADGCRGGAPYRGLCSHAAGGADVLAALADAEGPAVAFGSFTDAQMPAGAGALAAQPPRYLIELMPAPPGATLFRITALGFGSAQATQVAVQAYYRKLAVIAVPATLPSGAPAPPGASAPTPPGRADGAAPPTPGTPGGPGLRVGWREIGNWQDTAGASS